MQRSAIALAEKNVDYDITYIDLGAKPEWFLAVSPLGKVPLLRVGDDVLFESSAINEYLDEAYGARLHSEDLIVRAKERAWIELGGALGAISYLMMIAEDEEGARKQAKKAHDTLTRLETTVAGPFFRGADFSLVDASLAPFLQRLYWMHEIIDLGIYEDNPKVKAWTDALLERPSIQASTIPNIRERFRAYISGDRSPTIQTDPSWIARQI